MGIFPVLTFINISGHHLFEGLSTLKSVRERYSVVLLFKKKDIKGSLGKKIIINKSWDILAAAVLSKHK